MTTSVRGLIAFFLFSTAAVGSTSYAATAAPAAEFAIRWDVKDGGPKTAREALDKLGGGVAEPETYEVTYLDVTPPADAPSGFKSILRQRIKEKKKYQLTFKYRGDVPVPTSNCPLSATPDETKNEIDISFTAAAEPKQTFSYSCTLKSKNTPPPLPASLQARPKACSSKMTRLEIGALKVEEWELPGDTKMIEVSREGSNTPEELRKFRTEVADVFLAEGVKPSDRSKTELGGDCP